MGWHPSYYRLRHLNQPRLPVKLCVLPEPRCSPPGARSASCCAPQRTSNRGRHGPRALPRRATPRGSALPAPATAPAAPAPPPAVHACRPPPPGSADLSAPLRRPRPRHRRSFGRTTSQRREHNPSGQARRQRAALAWCCASPTRLPAGCRCCLGARIAASLPPHPSIAELSCALFGAACQVLGATRRPGLWCVSPPLARSFGKRSRTRTAPPFAATVLPGAACTHPLLCRHCGCRPPR